MTRRGGAFAGLRLGEGRLSAARAVTAALLGLAVLLPHPGVYAQPTAESLREAQEQARAEQDAAAEAARQAAAAEAEEQRLAEQRVAAARAVQAAETAVDAALDRLRAAEAARDEATAEVRRRTDALAPMMPAMRRLALWPAETLLVVPATPQEALRGALVLRGLARQLRQEAESLRAAREEAEARAREAAEEATRLAFLRTEAEAASAALDAQIAAARARQSEAQAAEREAARRTKGPSPPPATLQEVLARLERERERKAAQAAERARQEQQRERAEARRSEERSARQVDRQQEAALAPVPRARGGRAIPVAGRIVREFGASTVAGPARGITFATPPGARVVSPCSGRTVFSGPFRTYGLLLIVDCGSGYHFVLAGLGRLDAVAGSRLLAGEPVGIVGGEVENAGQNSRTALYVELRRNGRPVDPRSWFSTRG